MNKKGEFGEGSILRHILTLAFPLVIAETVHVLYSIVDRMFLSRLEGVGTLALSGVGIVFPLISLINAFSSFVSSGGQSICSIKRGSGDTNGAENILCVSFTLLLIFGTVLTLAFSIFSKNLIRILGSDESVFPYAYDYFRIYTIGIIFSLISLGMNVFLTLQGHSVIGMFTVLIGAVLNTLLDPLFIFKFNMGVKGAAIATVISQGVSAVWVVCFLLRRKTKLRLRRLSLKKEDVKSILSLGVSGFMFKATNSLTQGVVNVVLKIYGGVQSTLYIASFSIINSLRDFVSIPNTALTSSMQPVCSYNYGAEKYKRVRTSIWITLIIVLSYSLIMWAFVFFSPSVVARIFTPDEELVKIASPCIRIYFSLFFMMAFQSVGQNTFISLNYPKKAVFFSLFRKAILVVPLTLIFPLFIGVNGVFYAEAVSQGVGGACCFITMLCTVYRSLKRKEREINL